MSRKKIKKLGIVLFTIMFFGFVNVSCGGSVTPEQPSGNGTSGEGNQEEPATKHCWNCGTELAANVKFCPSCGADQTKNYLPDSVWADETIYIFYYDDNALKISDYLPGKKFSGIIEQISKDIGENSVYSQYLYSGKTISYSHVLLGEEPADIHTDEVTWEFGFTLDKYPGARLVNGGNPEDGSEYSKLCNCQGFVKINGKIYRIKFLGLYLNMDYIDVKFMMNDGTENVYFEETIPKEDIIKYGHEGAFAFERIERWPRRQGYVFNGWYYDSECTDAVPVYTQCDVNGWDTTCYHSYEKLTKHTNFYAKWVPNTSGYEPGDIVLSDGTKVSYEQVQSITDEQKSKAVAVISYISEDGTTAYGVGVHQTETPVYWSAKNVYAYDNFIENGTIQNFTHNYLPETSGHYSESGLVDSGFDTVYFKGPFNSFAVWDNICKADPEGVHEWNVANNYPSFDYVNNYGTTYNLPEQYKNDWFMPHPFDFIKTSRNYDLVSASYNAVSAIPLREHEFQAWDNEKQEYVTITGGYWTAMTWLDDVNDKAHWAIPYFFAEYDDLDRFYQTDKYYLSELSLLDISWGKCGTAEFVVPFHKFKSN